MDISKFEIIDKPEWGKLATFVPNKNLPIYNWLYYKEGFSRDLVFKILDIFKTKGIVLDPFCGVGTTLLACKERGIDAIGFDVLPIALFATKVKLSNYNVDELKENAKKLLKKKFVRPEIKDAPTLMKKGFSKYALEDIIFFKEKINEIEDNNRNFFLLALINAALKVSYARKDGATFKIEKRNVAPLRIMLRRVIYKMIRDYEKFKINTKSNVVVEQCDARRMNLEDESIDAIITSPPYLNQIDYTKVYAIENYIIGEKTEPMLRSFIGFDEENYFKDMELVLKEMYRVCRYGARIAIVVANAYIPDRIIESDIIFSQIAEKLGFKVDKIYVLNKRHALEGRTIKVGTLRESMIILEKII